MQNHMYLSIMGNRQRLAALRFALLYRSQHAIGATSAVARSDQKG